MECLGESTSPEHGENYFNNVDDQEDSDDTDTTDTDTEEDQESLRLDENLTNERQTNVQNVSEPKLTAEQFIIELNYEVEGLKKEKTKLYQKLESVKGMLEQKSKLATENEDTVKVLKDQIGKNIEENKNLKTSLMSVKDMFEQKSKLAAEYEDTIKDLKDQIGKISEESKMLKTRMMSAEDMFEQKSKLVAENEDTIKDLRNQIGEITEENKNLKRNLNELKEEIKRKDKELAESELEENTLKEQCGTNRDRENHLKKVITGYEEEIKTRTKNQEEQAKEIERLRQFEAVHPALKDQLAELESRLSQFESGKFEIEDKLMQAENEKRQLGEEKQKLLLRLSKLAGAKLTLDNPNIADLSDQKRPTKLAEEFAELYDNEWTDAFEDVKFEDERETISFMLELLKSANELCHQVSDEHMDTIKTSICKLTIFVNDPFGRQPKEQHAQQETSSSYGNTSREHAGPRGPSVVASQDTNIELKENLEDDAEDKYKVIDKIEQLCDKSTDEKSLQTEEIHEVTYDFNTFPHEGKKTVMELRKFIEVNLSNKFETIATDVIARKTYKDNKPQNKVLKYIAKCVNICWSMCRQEPPVKIDFPEEQGDMHFDTSVYKAYTKSGRLIDYIVWPALYLHENGPLLCKGVAQGKNGNKN